MEFRRIFMRPDESFDVRLNNTFRCLRTKAERDHKVVSVTDGVLIVDGMRVFSLKDGYIPNGVADDSR